MSGGAEGAALRAERRGALFGLDAAGPLRFLDVPLGLLIGASSLRSAVAPASVGFSVAAEPWV